MREANWYQRIIHIAVRCLPAQERTRYSEQWAADLEETQGTISKLVFALGLILAAARTPRSLTQWSSGDDLAAALIFITIFVFMISVGSSSIQPNLATVSVGVNANLNVRKGPSMNGDVLAIIPHGTKVDILRGLNNGWTEIQVSGTNGNVYRGFSYDKFLTHE